MVGLIRRCSFAATPMNEDDRRRDSTISWCEFFWEYETWSFLMIRGSAFSPKTFHRQPRRDPVNVEFVLFEFTDIPAVLAVDADKISSRFYYVVDGETHLGWQLQPIVYIFINTSIYRSHCIGKHIPLICRGTITKRRAETRDSGSFHI